MKTVIEMAREAGASPSHNPELYDIWNISNKALERFAELVRADERKPCQTCEALARTVMLDQTSHDTSPPAQRTWVGLTLEEIDTEWGLFMSGQGSGYIPDFVHAIETKLKEKNTWPSTHL